MRKYLFLAFLIVPVVEIFLITRVASQIAWGPTIVLVIGVSMVGAWLVRREGLSVISRIREGFGQLKVPTNELADGAMIFFASALLLTPGFLTDFIGLALLIPPIRAIVRGPVVSFFSKRLEIKAQSFGVPPGATSGFGTGQGGPFGAGQGSPFGSGQANPFGFGRGPASGRRVYDADSSRSAADADLTDITPDPPELPEQ